MFNRQLRGELSEEDFDDGTLIDGSSINNDDRDFTERRLTGRAGYEFQPGVTAFVEASTNERDFAERIDDDGTLNGSSESSPRLAYGSAVFYYFLKLAPKRFIRTTYSSPAPTLKATGRLN